MGKGEGLRGYRFHQKNQAIRHTTLFSLQNLRDQPPVLTRTFQSFTRFFFKQKTAYELRPRGWSSDVCSSDLSVAAGGEVNGILTQRREDAKERRGCCVR